MTNIENIHHSTGKTLIDMVNTIKGIYKDGVIKPLEELKIKDNTEVIIVFSDHDRKKKSAFASAAGSWKEIDTEALKKQIYEDRIIS
jgi:predicted DNA-binding antitoxin AbrB/MazE fold protein